RGTRDDIRRPDGNSDQPPGRWRARRPRGCDPRRSRSLGDRASLEELVRRHQRWIYNIAIRMLHHPQDAEDATQEILLKAVTRLSSFEDRSSFRTWLYRIAVNHLLNMKRGRVERESLTFREYGAGLDSIPDLDLPDPSGSLPDARLLVNEAMLTCTSGM